MTGTAQKTKSILGKNHCFASLLSSNKELWRTPMAELALEDSGMYGNYLRMDTATISTLTSATGSRLLRPRNAISMEESW